jgi:hypothetical protein
MEDPRMFPSVRPRRRRLAERGAQSLEWIGLGSFVLTAMLAATAYAQGHLGDQVGQALVHSLTQVVGK